MLKNPLHLRLEKLLPWQHFAFMVALCERMYPNYALFCQKTQFAAGERYRQILDLVWEILTVKQAKIDFDSQLEKFETAIPLAGDFDLYGVYPAIDACVALSELLHACISGETLEHAIAVSQVSINSVVMLEMTQAEQEMSDQQLGELESIQQEWDIQWEIYRLLIDSEKNNSHLLKGLRADLREANNSNIGIFFDQ